MRKLILLLGLVLSLPVGLFGQAGSYTTLRSGATLPAACNPGGHFFKTTAPIGTHQCIATNTWAWILEASSAQTVGGVKTFSSAPIFSTLTGLLIGNAGSALTAITSSTVGQVVRVTGANTFATGAINLADLDAASFTQTGTGAVARTPDAKLKDILHVTDFGAVCDGTTDDATALQAAITAAAAVGGKLIFPAATCASTTDLDLPPGGNFTLSGAFGGFQPNYRGSVIKFTGATNGLHLVEGAGNNAGTVIEGLALMATNAGGLACISADAPSTPAIVDVIIRNVSCTTNILTGSPGPGRWAYGFHGNFFESSEIYSLHIPYGATVGFHCENACGGTTVYGFNMNALDAADVQRGIELTSDAGPVIFSGGIMQGNFIGSMINTAASGTIVDGMYLEGHEVTYTDGAHVVVGDDTNDTVGAIFRNITGVAATYQFGVAGGQVYHTQLANTYADTVTLNANATSSRIDNVRIFDTYSNAGVGTLVTGLTEFGGTDYAIIVDCQGSLGCGAGPIFRLPTTTGVAEFGFGLTSPILQSEAADTADAGVVRLANAESICWEASAAGTDVCLAADSSEAITVTGGTLAATSLPFSGITAATNTTAAMVLGSGASFRSAVGILGIPNSVTPPATSTVGDVYFDSNAAAGSRFLLATATDTLTGMDNPFGASIDAAEVAADVATQAEIDLKANLAGPTFTGVVTVPAEAYTGAGWNADPAAADRDSVRDQIEAEPSATRTLTGKTFDCNGAGNVCTVLSQTYYVAGVCQNTTASLGFNTPTTNAPSAACVTGSQTQQAVAQFDAATDESVQHSIIMLNWNLADLTVQGRWRAAATSGNVDWNIQFACVSDAETGDPSWDTDVVSIIDAAKGTTLQHNDFTATITASTHLSTCAANEILFWRFFRDADDAGNDTMTGDAELISLSFSLWRLF